MEQGAKVLQRWVPHGGKHLSTTKVPWNAIVIGTKQGPAKYLPYVTDDIQLELELRCIREGVLIGQADDFPCAYYLKMGKAIGACSGVETVFIYANWQKTGDIHGRPISEELLRRILKKKGLSL